MGTSGTAGTPGRPTERNRTALGVVLVAVPWIAAALLFGPGRNPMMSLMLIGGAALIQLATTRLTRSNAWVARIRTNHASQIWLGGFAGALTALVLARAVPIEASVLEVIVGALGATLALAFAEEYSIAAAMSSGQNVRRAAVIGTGEEAAEWVALFEDHPEIGIEFVGCIGDAGSARRVGLGHTHLGTTNEMLDILNAYDIDLPIVAVASFRRPAIRSIVNQLLESGHDVAMTWGVGRLSSARLTSAVVGHETLPLIRAKRPQVVAQGIKRVFDLITASVLLTVTAPILALLALAVKLESKGPALFVQERVGLGGKTFRIFKLRSMKTTAEEDIKELSELNQRKGPLFKMERDPRVTKVGRLVRATSLDELPQLWNVIKGDMSLVGPRPALVSETEQFDQELTNRSQVRPGLTGLWQVEARANEAFGAYRRLDLHYLENWSLMLDIRIMIATAQMLTIGTLVGPIVKRVRSQAVRRAAVDVTGPTLVMPNGVVPKTKTGKNDDGEEAVMLGA